MSDYGTKEKPETERRDPPLTETLKAGHDLWINGHHLESWDSIEATIITIDGRLFGGTYAEAIQHMRTLTPRQRSEF